MKKSEVLAIYEIVKAAKVTKMEDADKFKVVKALKTMKPVATDFDEFKKDALDKLKSEDHDAMTEKAQKWQSEGENTTLSVEERAELNKYFNEYNNKVLECVREEAEKDIELSIEKLNDESFQKFVASNDWNTEQALAIYELFV